MSQDSTARREADAPVIHIVTPCRDAAGTIDATIESVLSQRGTFHLRYHVQDGASTDGTPGRLEHWERALASGAFAAGCLSARFTWDSAPDDGMYDAIAKGFARLEMAPDDFMTWLNADDALWPDCLERIARVAASRPDVTWLGGARCLVDASGAIAEYDPLNQYPREILAAGLCEGKHWQFLQQEGSFWRRSLYDAAGGLDTRFRLAGDWDLWRRFAEKAPRHGLAAVLGAFRLRPGQLTSDLSPYWAELDQALPPAVRDEAFRRLVAPVPSYFAPMLRDPLAGPAEDAVVSGNAFDRAEAWRRAVCPDTPWPRITIVTPSFNQGLFLDACMRSVLDQGYPNLEYIVMDGGSIDNSLSVIRSHANRLAYWQSRPDGGQYRAIEDGLNRGTGEIMAWLNADDLYVGPCLFKVAMTFMLDAGARWITGRPTVCDQMGRLVFLDRDLSWSRGGMLDMAAPLDGVFMGQDAMFWRRSLWEEAGGRLDEEVSLAADYDLWLRFARIAPLCTVRDIFSAFRHHGDQRSVTQKREYIAQMGDVVARELDELSYRRPSGDFFTPGPVLPLAYENWLAPLGGLPADGGTSLFVPAREVADLATLGARLETARRNLAEMGSYHEAMHLDDAGLHFQVKKDLATAKCVSFDCFDTILFRLSDEPTRLFVEVGRRLRENGALRPSISPEAFQQLREAAEEQARQEALEKRRTTECSIEEIYVALGEVVRDPQLGVKTEIETERDFCHCNPTAMALIRHFHSLGLKIAILSDNYLSSQQLASILRHNGVDLDLVDLVLTSRDAAAAKFEGKLYGVAAARLGLNPQEMLHIGDSHYADVHGARLARVRGFHYPRNDAYTQRVQSRERMLCNTSRQAASLASFRVLARRLGGLVNTAWREYYQDGAFLFGPALARYADWVVRQCREEGITCCLAFMREAQTLLPLIKRSAKAAGVKLEVKPFHVSRHSVNLASLLEVTPKTVFDKTVKHRQASARTLLKALGIPPERITEIGPDLMDVVLNDAERLTFSTLIAKHPVYSRLLDTLALKARKAFLYYALAQFGGHERLAVADIGFRGSIQLAMERIFRHEGVGSRITGLYFCTQRASARAVLEGADVRSYLGDMGAWRHETHTLYSHPEILEQSLNAVCGTTLGYSSNGDGAFRPELEDVAMPFDQLYKRWLVQLGIMSFQKLWLDYAGPRLLDPAESSWNRDRCLEEIDREVVYIMQRLFCFPTAEEAGRLGSLYHDDNDGTDLGGIICDEAARARFREGGLEKLSESMVYWPHGVVGIERQGVFDQMFAVKNHFEQS